MEGVCAQARDKSFGLGLPFGLLFGLLVCPACAKPLHLRDLADIASRPGRHNNTGGGT